MRKTECTESRLIRSVLNRTKTIIILQKISYVFQLVIRKYLIVWTVVWAEQLSNQVKDFSIVQHFFIYPDIQQRPY